MTEELESYVFKEIQSLCQGLSTDQVAKIGTFVIIHAAEVERQHGTPAYAAQLIEKAVSVLQKVSGSFGVGGGANG